VGTVLAARALPAGKITVNCHFRENFSVPLYFLGVFCEFMLFYLKTLNDFTFHPKTGFLGSFLSFSLFWGSFFCCFWDVFAFSCSFSYKV